MSYTKRVWTNSDTEAVTYEDFNRIEGGIEANDTEIANMKDENIDGSLAAQIAENTNQINVLKEEIEITKTITTVANTWTDVGISISDIVSKNGLYAIFVHETINKLSYFGLWSGVMSMYPHTTNSEYSCEIPLHCSCHAMYNATVVKFRVANTIGSISPNAHIEIYTDCSIETTMMFKFKKILEV